MTATKGPLVVSARNPRYFEDATGRITVLTGSHTWNNLSDLGPKGAVVPFDWDAYLDLLVANGHNFVRGWAWDSLGTWNPADAVVTCPWMRTGPGEAWDGGPRIDLTKPDPAYYGRLRERVKRAGGRGIWVSVMLFENWSNFSQNEAPLAAHMFASGNNVNGIDILPSPHHGVHAAWSRLRDAEVLAIQKRHVADVVEAVHDLDNVLYEIANEGGPTSHDWQNLLTEHIRALEAGKAVRHPVGQTGGMGTLAARLHASAADWVSPDASATDGHAFGYRTAHYTWGEGPEDRGDRPVLVDTDHVWGVGGSVDWVWKTMLRGYNLLYMDPWSDQPAGFFKHPRWPAPTDLALRRAMGTARALLERLDLAQARPAAGLASSGYCTADPGRGYLVYAPGSGTFTVELPAGEWLAEWHDPAAGGGLETERVVTRVGTHEFAPPAPGPAVLFLTML